MCFLWFHDWEELGNKRVCRRCGMKQRWNSGYESGYWENPDIDKICTNCDGKGKIFDNDFRKMNCPVCNGTGLKPK